MNRRRTEKRRRGGFTLVELLVVVVIIGILAALMTVAVFQAMKAVNRAELYQECVKIGMGFKAFEDQFAALPPDGAGGYQAVAKFQKKAFARAKSGVKPPGDVSNDKTGAARAIVYWLTEVNKDERNPFKQESANYGGANQSETVWRFVELAQDRIDRGKGYYYPPRYVVGQDPPYIYFCTPYTKSTFEWEGRPFKPYDKGQANNQGGGGGSGGNQRNYLMPESCQIICAGLDKKLGVGGTLSTGNQGGGGAMISEDDEDNLTNADKRVIGDIE